MDGTAEYWWPAGCALAQEGEVTGSKKSWKATLWDGLKPQWLVSLRGEQDDLKTGREGRIQGHTHESDNGIS